jgi:hypothetical protein
VTDDYHENSANSPWNGDSIQLMIADGGRSNQVALYNYALGGTEFAFGEIIIDHEAGAPGQPAPGITEAVVTRDIVKKKTYYEIKMPADALGLTAPLTAGTKIGLGMAVNDGDEFYPGQGGWGGLGAHAIVFGKTPSETALLTLSTNVPGADRLFFSAINTAFDNFSFRANDKGISIVNAASGKLIIDGQTVTLTASPKVGDATDFAYKPAIAFLPNSEHIYSIEMKDTLGNTVTIEGSFKTAQYANLTAADKVTVDTTKPGFIWNVHQNDSFTTSDNVRPLSQLAGSLGENFADRTVQGIAISAGTPGANNLLPIRFEIATVINMDVNAGSYGNIQPDDQMPGIPGTTGGIDGAAGEILTYLDLSAGKHTLIVNSDDGFRTTFGNVADVFQAQVAGEYIGSRGSADTAFTVYAQEAGIYAFRTVWQNATADGNIEWLSVKADGTKVLLNDTANGGIRAYRTRIGKGSPAIIEATPGSGETGVAPGAPIHLSIQDGDTSVDTASVTLTVDGTQVNATTAKTGNLTKVDYNASAMWISGLHTASLSFTAGGVARTQSWQFTIPHYAILTKAQQAVSVDTSKRGFLWNVFQNESNILTTLANTELALAGQLKDTNGAALENLADPSITGPALAAGVKVGPLYRFEIPTVINLSQIEGESNGYFTPDEQMPGIPAPRV